MIVRIHLMRHGETECNASGIVCGHMETPLNKKGIEQATNASMFWCKNYWKSYSSDLSRAQSTAEIVLKMKSNNSRSSIIIDKRLREVAKGVREGRSVNLSYDEAMMEYINEQKQRKDLVVSSTPFLETEDDVWKRIQSWIKDVVFDALNDDNLQSNGNKDEGIEHLVEGEIVKTVFASSHSGTIRIAIQNLVADQLSNSVQYQLDNKIINNLDEKYGKSGTKMVIPNTSVTIIDIKPKTSFFSTYKNEEHNDEIIHENDLLWDAKLIELTCDKHLQKPNI